MNFRHLIALLAALTLLTACEYISGEPPEGDMKKAVAELRKIDPATMQDFKKEGCRKGTISFMFHCTFSFNLMNDGKATKYDMTEARFVSQDGSTWDAYEK